MITGNNNNQLRYFILCCGLLMLVTWQAVEGSAQVKGHKFSATKVSVINNLVAQDGSSTAATTALPIGETVTKNIVVGQSDRYRVNLTTGQYLEVVVTQREINLVVRLLDSSGKVILEADGFTKDQGTDRLSWVNEVAGEYQVAIGTTDPNASGSYQLAVTSLRVATENDRQLAQAGKWNIEALELVTTGKSKEAIAKLEQIIALEAKVRGEAHPALISPLTGLIDLYGTQRNFNGLENLLQRLTTIAEKNFSPQSLETVQHLVTVGSIHFQREEFDKAIAAGQQALAIQEKLAGGESRTVARILNFLGRSYRRKKDYVQAEAVYLRSLAISEKIVGVESIEVARATNDLGLTYSEQRNYKQAELMLQRSLKIFEKALGPNHVNVARILSSLAGTYYDSLNYQQAEICYKRSLEIQEKQANPDYGGIINVLNNFGRFCRDIGDYEQAEKLLRRSLHIREKTLPANHPAIAIALSNVGFVYTDQGDYEQAERVYQQALTIREKVLGKEHLEVSIALNNLSAMYFKKGDYARAQTLSERSLAISEKILGVNHGEVATNLHNLAGIYNSQGKMTEAITLYQRALKIKEKELGLEHPSVAATINNLALVYLEQKKLAEAAALLERSLKIMEKVLGANHPSVAVVLNGLAFVDRERRNFAQAENAFQRSLKIYQRTFGDSHPFLASTYNHLASLYELQHRTAEAIAARVASNEIRERDLVRNLVGGSENQKLKYLAISSRELDATLTLHLQTTPQDKTIAEAAMTIALRRKGRALDAMTDALSNLRRLASEEDRQLLDQLAKVRSKITVQLNKPGEKSAALTAQIRALQDQAEELEAQISRRSAELGRQLQLQRTPISLDKIQQSIPRNTALVEFIVYHPVTYALGLKDQYSAPRYAVYVLQHEGMPLAVDLGPVETIDQAVSAWRKVLIKQPGKALSNVSTNVKPLARKLDRLVMQPVRQLLGNQVAKRLLISPDGNLNLIPFDALVDEQQRFLVERYEISYLTSGRDLLRLSMLGNQPDGEKRDNVDPRKLARNKVANNNLTDNAGHKAANNRLTAGKEQTNAAALTNLATVILANPDYGQGQGPTLLGLQGGPLKQLPGAGEEGRQLQRQLPQAQLLQGTQASETVVRSLQRPAILHIATHGYFLQSPNVGNNSTDDAATGGGSNAGSVLNAQRALSLEQQDQVGIDPALLRQANPLLRSYLFFAGANSTLMKQLTSEKPAPVAENVTRELTLEKVTPQSSASASGNNAASSNAASNNASSNTPVSNNSVTVGNNNVTAGNNSVTAGDNNVVAGDNDGVMSALDVAGLNLLGTKLVVLSACDTGLGEVKNGDGVYGLRRALVLAGAESQMISLWPVADRATRELMVNYYQTLKLGKGRSAGLRTVRLKMLRDPRHRHPYYWASFIQSGEWGKLSE